MGFPCELAQENSAAIAGNAPPPLLFKPEDEWVSNLFRTPALLARLQREHELYPDLSLSALVDMIREFDRE